MFDLAGTLDSTASFDVGLSWLENCRENHHACNQTASRGKTFPTRLLDLGDSAAEYIKLVSTPHDASNASPGSSTGLRYATLSHCWGDDKKMLQLTTASETEMRQQINVHNLPTTLKDAVDIVRRFQIRYLWVDAVCIIQDSVEDWQAEANKMTDVYSNSTLNIAASAARDCEGGCYSKARRQPLKTLPIKIGSVYGQAISVFPNGVGDIGQLWNPDTFGESRLNSRGWVLQETLLSPRTLSYRSSTLSWSCRDLEAVDGRPSGPLDHHSRHTPLKRQLYLLESTTTRDDQWREACSRFWKEVVHDYSGRFLTKKEDKLVALAGIARRFYDLTGYAYRAGLWKELLPAQLCWIPVREHSFSEAEHQRREKQEQPTEAIPSWSWASRDGCVDLTHKTADIFVNLQIDKHFCILDITTSLVYPSNEFGQVRGGRLLVRGLLRPRKFRTHHAPTVEYNSKHYYRRWHLPHWRWYDWPFFTYGTAEDGIYRHWDSTRALADASRNGEVYYLLVMRDACMSALPRPVYADLGMMLIPIYTPDEPTVRRQQNGDSGEVKESNTDTDTQTTRTTFRRVGVFEISKRRTKWIFDWSSGGGSGLGGPEEIVIV